MGLIFLRHPPVEGRGLCYGRHDPPLLADAPARIARATAALPPAPRLLASPAPRCRALAQAAAAALGLVLDYDPRLRELDFGTWEGRPWAAIPRAELDRWAEDPETRAPPGGETFAALKARVHAALAGLDAAVIVTHAGPIRAARILAGQADFATAFGAEIPHATPIRLPALARCP
ncbi:MAG: histidine phosphatase family protein [Pseudomonadota bacterium]